jgi:hypothetical protein
MSIAGIILLAGAAMQSSQWSYRLEWEHDGAGITHFELCVDNACNRVEASRSGQRTWWTRLPVLSEGFHVLVINACNNAMCTAGDPTVAVNVTPGPTIGQPVPPPTPPTPTPPPAPGGKAPPRHPPRKTT